MIFVELCAYFVLRAKFKIYDSMAIIFFDTLLKILYTL